jgi:hypothetical protein
VSRACPALLPQVYQEPLAAIVRRAYVHPPQRFGAALADEEEGNDVFMCEYEYDAGWKRFRRRGGAGELGPHALRRGLAWAWGGHGQQSRALRALTGKRRPAWHG